MFGIVTIHRDRRTSRSHLNVAIFIQEKQIPFAQLTWILLLRTLSQRRQIDHGLKGSLPCCQHFFIRAKVLVFFFICNKWSDWNVIDTVHKTVSSGHGSKFRLETVYINLRLNLIVVNSCTTSRLHPRHLTRTNYSPNRCPPMAGSTHPTRFLNETNLCIRRQDGDIRFFPSTNSKRCFIFFLLKSKCQCRRTSLYISKSSRWQHPWN